MIKINKYEIDIEQKWIDTVRNILSGRRKKPEYINVNYKEFMDYKGSSFESVILASKKNSEEFNIIINKVLSFYNIDREKAINILKNFNDLNCLEKFSSIKSKIERITGISINYSYKLDEEVSLEQLSDDMKKDFYEEKIIYEYLHDIIETKKFFNYTNSINAKTTKERNVKLRDLMLSEFSDDVCPYCNRNYISRIQINDRLIKYTSTFDHIFPQKYYPFLSLSLYNLIPSCYVCNSLLKRDDTQHSILSPYDNGFSNLGAYFEIDLNEDVDNLLRIKNPKVGINVNDNGDKRVRSNIEVFKLNQVYSVHKSYVGELILKKKKMISNGKLINIFPHPISQDELYLYYFNVYFDIDEHGKRPLSKLTYDILYKNKF